MGLPEIARKLLPTAAVASIARARKSSRRRHVAGLPPLTEGEFRSILANRLLLQTGDCVYIGSSVDQLALDFPFYRILDLVRDTIGPKGTILFPTYPNRSPMSSYQYLSQGRLFDVRRTPSFTGLLSEVARRNKDAVRSLHPTKSVVAIGPMAKDLTKDHPNSPYPYDRSSPYYKLVDARARIIGLGVWTEYMSFVYTIDDALKDNPPVRTYHPDLFAAPCVGYDGQNVTVETYAHDMRQVIHDVPAYMRKHISSDLCIDMNIGGMKFFTADAKRLFDTMLGLAKRGITVYPRRLYARAFLDTLRET